VERTTWPILCRAGVPEAGHERGPVPAESLTAAIRDVSADPASLDDVQRDALHAWLGAFRDHWPRAFREIGGPPARDLLRAFDRGPVDRNRYLKLRRIALAHLAEVV